MGSRTSDQAEAQPQRDHGRRTQVRLPKAVRAVANANALNPISIVVPCHRVIGSGGDLRGYSGGLARKRWLLIHEGVRMLARKI